MPIDNAWQMAWMNERMNDSSQIARRCPPSSSDVRGGGGRAILRYLSVLENDACMSYLHHFCSIGTGSARRSPAPRRTPRRTSWSPSVWSMSLARGNPLSPSLLWLRATLRWAPRWTLRWGSHWRLDARFHWEWDDPFSPPPGPCSGRSSLRLKRSSPSHL